MEIGKQDGMGGIMGNCRTIGYPYLGILLIALSVMSSSCELQSDEDLREDIVGSWKREACEFPYSSEDNGVTEASPLRSFMTFYADGRISEAGPGAYCSLSGCDTIWLSNDCSCSWEILDGSLRIINYDVMSAAWTNITIPIKCLDGDQLVFDNYGNKKKACYSRQ